MEKKQNFSFKSKEFIQCIIDNFRIRKSFLHHLSLKKCEVKSMEIKSSNCVGAQISKCNFSFGKWNEVNLKHVEMDGCEIEGLRINGYMISELIEQQKSKNLNGYLKDDVSQ